MGRLDVDEWLGRGAPSVSIPARTADEAARFVRDPLLSRRRIARRVVVGAGLAGVLALGGTTAFAVGGMATHLGWFAPVGTTQTTSLGAKCENAIRAVPEPTAEVARYASQGDKELAAARANQLLEALDLGALDIQKEADRLTAELDGATTTEGDVPTTAMNANSIETWALFGVAVDRVTAQLKADGFDPNIVTFEGAVECDSPITDPQ